MDLNDKTNENGIATEIKDLISQPCVHSKMLRLRDHYEGLDRDYRTTARYFHKPSNIEDDQFKVLLPLVKHVNLVKVAVESYQQTLLAGSCSTTVEGGEYATEIAAYLASPEFRTVILPTIVKHAILYGTAIITPYIDAEDGLRIIIHTPYTTQINVSPTDVEKIESIVTFNRDADHVIKILDVELTSESRKHARIVTRDYLATVDIDQNKAAVEPFAERLPYHPSLVISFKPQIAEGDPFGLSLVEGCMSTSLNISQNLWNINIAARLMLSGGLLVFKTAEGGVDNTPSEIIPFGPNNAVAVDKDSAVEFVQTTSANIEGTIKTIQLLQQISSTETAIPLHVEGENNSAEYANLASMLFSQNVVTMAQTLANQISLIGYRIAQVLHAADGTYMTNREIKKMYSIATNLIPALKNNLAPDVVASNLQLLQAGAIDAETLALQYNQNANLTKITEITDKINANLSKNGTDEL